MGESLRSGVAVLAGAQLSASPCGARASAGPPSRRCRPIVVESQTDARAAPLTLFGFRGGQAVESRLTRALARARRLLPALAAAGALGASGGSPALAGTCANPDSANECRAVCPNLGACVECCHGEGPARTACALVCAQHQPFAGSLDSV